MPSQPAVNRYRQPQAITLAEPFRLAALGTATYLSYWKLFYAVCGACVGQRQKPR
jgi:hypothetical protein